MAKAKAPDPKAVDAWLAGRPKAQRDVLQRLREQILELAPDLVETIAWGVPMFYLGNKPVVGLNAFTKHVSLGLAGGTLDALRDELARYDVAKHTVRFSPDAPLPKSVVRKILKSALAQARPAPA